MNAEMETSDLRARVVALEQTAIAREQRLLTVEDWQRKADVFNAKKEVAWEGLDQRFSRVEQSIEKINSNLTWIVRLVLGGIVMSVVAFLIRGGFSM